MNVVYTSLMNAVDDATGTFFPDQRGKGDLCISLSASRAKILALSSCLTSNSFKNYLIKLQLLYWMIV